jgi:hypothetical protein
LDIVVAGGSRVRRLSLSSVVGPQSGALGRPSANHRTRLRFRELSTGLLTALATDFRQILSRFFVHKDFTER